MSIARTPNNSSKERQSLTPIAEPIVSGEVLLRNRPMDQFHHNVYVILLDREAVKHPRVKRLNPKWHRSKPAVYVGMTGLPVADRFRNHVDGYKSSFWVKKFGVRLLPQLYEHLNPMPYEHAAQMEKDLADDLRVQGYAVVGGT